MQTKFISFKKFEVSAESKEAAQAMVEAEHFSIMGDATMAYKKAKKESEKWTERDLDIFCKEYLEKKTKLVPGVGHMITLEKAVADTRERPYRFENVKSEGRREFQRVFTAHLVHEGASFVIENADTKTAAQNVLKQMYKDGKLKDDVVVTVEKHCIKGEPTAFKGYYTPSINTQNGTWLVFGIEK